MESLASYLESEVPTTACEVAFVCTSAGYAYFIMFYFFEYRLLPTLLPPPHHALATKKITGDKLNAYTAVQIAQGIRLVTIWVCLEASHTCKQLKQWLELSAVCQNSLADDGNKTFLLPRGQKSRILGCTLCTSLVAILLKVQYERKYVLCYVSETHVPSRFGFCNYRSHGNVARLATTCF